jgi:hypothetical protein
LSKPYTKVFSKKSKREDAMKKLILIVYVFAIFFAVSCNENILTDQDSYLLSKPDVRKISDVIKICCEVFDPYSGACMVNGCVEYEHQLLPGPKDGRDLYTVLLTLKMDSQLCDKLMMMHLEWLITGKSEDQIVVSEEGIAIVDKYYEITNRDDIVLFVQYLVTTEGVGVADIVIMSINNSAGAVSK